MAVSDKPEIGEDIDGESAAGLFEGAQSPTSPEVIELTASVTPGEVILRPALAYQKLFDPETHEVQIVSGITRESYRGRALPEVMQLVEDLAEPLQGLRVVRISATMDGGGVAMINPPWVNLMRDLDIDAHWNILKSDEEQAHFNATKLQHNIGQDVAGTDSNGEPIRITEQNKDLHFDLAARNMPAFEKGALKDAQVVIIDDPQGAWVIRFLKGFERNGVVYPGINPDAKIIYRDHTHTDAEEMADEESPQGELWRYWRDECGIGLADAFVAHRPDFVPYDMRDKMIIAPAIVDDFEDLVAPLGAEDIQDGLDITDRLLLETGQHPLRRDKKHIAEISRFDPSKGKDITIELYAQARRKALENGMNPDDIPDLVMVGNGSVDDPDGGPLLEKITKLRDEQYADIKDCIKILRFSEHMYKTHDGRDVGVYKVVNALTSTSLLTTHTSTREGWETRITDTLLHGTEEEGNIPVVITNTGGMPYQVNQGVSGHIIPNHESSEDMDRAAAFMAEMMEQGEAYGAMRQTTRRWALEFSQVEISTLANAARMLRALHSVLGTGLDVRGSHAWLMSELASPL